MPIKIDPKRLRIEALDFDREEASAKNLFLNKKRVEKFAEIVHPITPSAAIDYLMECVIRCAKSQKGKK